MSNMEKFWKELVDLGPKFAGTSEEKLAINLIRKNLNNIGLSPEIIPFKYKGWGIKNKTQLKVEQPIKEDLEVYCFIWSPPTPPDGINGYVERLGIHEIWGQYEWCLFGVKDENDKYIAYISGHNEYPAIPQALFEGYTSLPHFSIGSKDTKRFLDFLANNKKIKVSGAIFSEDKGEIESNNIRVRIEKSGLNKNSHKKEYILITAHYDTLYNTPGAFDNAGGCAVLFGLAEWLFKNPLNIPVELLFTGAEEFNLAGSVSYCNNLKIKGELSQIKSVINLDGVGRGNTLEVWSGPENFAIRIWSLLSCDDLGFKKIMKYPPPPGSDHTPFYNEGVPVVMLSINDLSILHRPEDIIDEDKKRNLHLHLNLLKRFLPKLSSLE